MKNMYTCHWSNNDKPVFQRIMCSKRVLRVYLCTSVCVRVYVETTTILKLLSLREKSVLSATKIYGFRHLSVNCWIYTIFLLLLLFTDSPLSFIKFWISESEEWKGIESDIFFIKPTASHRRTIFISFFFLYFFRHLLLLLLLVLLLLLSLLGKLQYLKWHIPSRHTGWYRRKRE